MLGREMLPTISIIIPTYNSERVIVSCLKALMRQDYPIDKFEAIVVDNCSKDNTNSISQKLGARVFTVTGNPSQGCVQRNLGAQKSRFDYLFFLDHDMEMSDDLLKDFARKLNETKRKVDAWYVPEKIIGKSNFMTKIRTFERSFYNGTVVDAARIIKKERFYKTKQYDTSLSSGPADWDMDIQLKATGCTFGIIDQCVYHHEDHLSLIKYITKKTQYNRGGEIYREKWQNNKTVYNKIISKQYSARYRLVQVFFENLKWKMVAKNFHKYIIVFVLRLFVGIMYKVKKEKK